MTKDEAIEILNGIEQLWGNFPEDGDLVEEALQMAIKALEQQPCEDCISREEVLKLLEKEDWADTVYGVMALPSVTPTSDAEGNYESGYNCGYADAMNDIAEREGDY